MNRKAFEQERATILRALERQFNAAEERVKAAANAETGALKSAFASAKAALEQSARRNQIGTITPTDGMGDPNGVKFQINLVGQTWRHS